MTALYGFCDDRIGKAMLASDDLESGTGEKVDKVFVVESRFVLAILGVDITAEAIDLQRRFERAENVPAIASRPDLVVQLSERIRKISTYIYPEYKKAYNDGRIAELAWERIHDSPARMIAIDVTALEMFAVDFGIAFPHQKLHKDPKTTVLRNDLFYSFGLPTKFRNPEVTPEEAIADPVSFVGSVISEDRSRDTRIGNLGAFAIVEDSRIQLTSCFGSIDEYIDSTFKSRLSGFTIIVDSETE